MEKYLSYGSVVTLKGGTRKLFIIGIDLKSSKDGLIYDYCGCAYPWGYLGGDNVFLFNHDMIEIVHFQGYMSEQLNDYFDDVLWKHQKESGDKNE